MTRGASCCCPCATVFILLTVLFCLSLVFYYIGIVLKGQVVLVQHQHHYNFNNMLQQILKDMYIDPVLLEELADDQKQVLFFKMREEQIRRWKVREEKLDMEEKLKPKTRKESKKNVYFNCDAEDKIVVVVIEDEDSDTIDFAAGKKREEQEALKRAEMMAKKEAEEKLKKEMEAMDAKRKLEEQRLKEQQERLRKEREKKAAELKKKAEESERLKSMQEAKLQREKAELEKVELEKKYQQEEMKRQQALKELREKEELENQKRAEEAKREEERRKEEIYERMKRQKQEELKKEEEEQQQLQEEWEEREKKAKQADAQRRTSISQTRNEMTRLRKLAREREELNRLREETPSPSPPSSPGQQKPVFKEIVPDEKEKKKEKKQSFLFSKKKVSVEDGKKKEKTEKISKPGRPPLPTRPDISSPVSVTATRTEREAIAVKRDIVKPSRPPPPPTISPTNDSNPLDKPNKPPLPPRPKGREEVVKWWKEVEYKKNAGLDENKRPYEWFHGIISRQEAERLLENKEQGAYLSRVSERVWGYTVSYKDIVRCKHFLIDTTQGYQFFGTEQRVHPSLNELINYHKRNPVSGLGQEILRNPVGQDKTPPDYEELFDVESTAI